MKKRYIALFLFAAMLLPLFRANATALSWYFRKGDNHTQPKLMDGLELGEYNTLSMGRDGDKVVYLTFDAGYENSNVEKTLDVLKRHDAVGAFFVLPAIIRSSPELMKRMIDEGHTVGNHTYSHRSIAYMDKATLKSECEKLEALFLETTGNELTKYFRPPEGSFSLDSLRHLTELGYTTVFWSFAYADWDNKAQKSHDWAKKKILDNVHDGMVMLLHPTSETNAAILDDVLTEIERMGYRFGSLDELKASSKKPTPETTNQDAKNADKLLDEYEQLGFVFCDNKNAKRKIALTFDDGPHPTQTMEILEVLDRFGVKATFFPIGKNVKEHPEITKAVIARGHELGNHTYSHRKVTSLDEASLTEEITKTESLLRELGVTPTLFRPPGGAYSETAIKTAHKLGYTYILWSWRLDTRDWEGKSVSSVVETVKANVTNGSVILFHDYVAKNSPTKEALETLIPYLLDEGYSFVTVSELIAA